MFGGQRRIARAGVLQQQRDLARGRDVHLAADLAHREDQLLDPGDFTLGFRVGGEVSGRPGNAPA